MSQIEDLSTELFISIFDYLTSIEILLAFFHLNQRFRSIIFYHLRSDDRLTQINFHQTNFLTYKRFCREILPHFKSIITSLQLGSPFSYGQIEEFTHYQLQRLDSLTIHLINPNQISEILQKFLNYNRLQWFDRITLILDEETIGWNERRPFCVQNIPVRKLNILGKVPYVFAQQHLTVCYSITHLNIHLKFDHDLLPLLYYLPNLIECQACVDDRGRDISNELTLLVPLPALKSFHYQGFMPSIYLRRMLMKINQQIIRLSIYTQDYQWPFHSSDVFSSDFFDSLIDLQTFDFHFRLITSDSFQSFFSRLNYLMNKNLCKNIVRIVSKDIEQIFSLPYAFNHLEIFDKNFFTKLSSYKSEQDNDWNQIEHLTLHVNIYDPLLLQLIHEKLTNVRSIDYQVPHFSLIPHENELHQYNLELSTFLSFEENEETNFFSLDTIKKLIIRDSVKYGCHVPQPLFLLTSNLVELDIDHFYLMQIISMLSQQTQTRILSTFTRLERLTVRQFDERLTDLFFSYFSSIKILHLIFTPYKMQVYRTQLFFLDDLLRSTSKLISLKFEHIRKPQEYYAYMEMQKNINEKFIEFYPKTRFFSKWFNDQTQKNHQYVTFVFSI